MVESDSYPYILDILRDIPSMLENGRIVMLVIDGLGTNNLDLKFLKKSTYRTVFPSSTPTFFYSLASLLRPEEHGFLEWNMRYGDRIITIPPWIDVNGNEVKAKGRVIFPFRSLSEIIRSKGFESTFYSPFANTSFSRASGRKAKHIKIEYLSEVFPLAGSDFIFIYWPVIDSLLHEGFKDEKFHAEMRMIETFISLLWKSIANGRLLVLSDHGLINVERRYRLPEMGSMPVGGARVAFYKDANKKKVESVLKRKRIPARVFYLHELPWFEGKISRRCYKNYGNVAVIAKGNAGFIYPYGSGKYIGAHGGVSREEMYVNVWSREK